MATRLPSELQSASRRASPRPRARLIAGLLAAGAGFMLGRTIVLIAGGALAEYVWWVAALLLVESVIDAVALVASIRWWIGGDPASATLVLRAVAAVVVVHAVRVLVFVLGRTGPWVDFDIRPGYRTGYAAQWSWAGVWFAATMATISLLVLLSVWRHRKRTSGR